MKYSERNVDMLHGRLVGKLFFFTLPIALSSMLQQLFNAADTFVVGLFGNADALAAVGINAEIVALIVTVSSGLSVGVNVLITNRIGKNQHAALPSFLQTAVLLAMAIGVVGATAGQAVAEPLLRLMQTPNDIMPSALAYLRVYLAGYPFLLLYDFGAAVLRARGDSRFPFFALVLSGAANVLLNFLFASLGGGVAGVAAVTDIAAALSATLVLYRLARDPAFRLSLKNPRIGWHAVGEILKTGIPSALQGAVFCFANLFVQRAVNRFGSEVIAGSTVAVHFEYFAYYVITAFGQTATTFAGQNHAAGQAARCRKILWLCLMLSFVCSLPLIVPVVVFRTFFAGLFSDEAPVIASACVRILCILLYEPICSLYEIPAGVLRGMGHASLPALDTVLGTCAFRIIWIFTIFRAHPSPEMLNRAFPLSWVATVILILLSFLAVRPFRDAGNTRGDEDTRGAAPNPGQGPFGKGP